MLTTPPCHKTFTVKMVQRAIDVTYAGIKEVGPAQRHRLMHYLECSKNPNAKKFLHHYWGQRFRAWHARINPPGTFLPPATSTGLASWYDDSGTTGCGFHATYGIATFVVPCGGHVTLTGPGGTVTATRDDSGPYVAGRTFDLNPATKAALGCGDLCAVQYR